MAKLRAAFLLDLLAVAQQSGRPLPGALSTLARYHYDSLIRHKLLYVRNEVEQGADVYDSMATARLLSPVESKALALAPQPDVRVWTMHRLASWKRRRVSGRLDLAVELVFPVVILMMASIVLLVALGTLSPLHSMISGLA